jgi:hypothetical protein
MSYDLLRWAALLPATSLCLSVPCPRFSSQSAAAHPPAGGRNLPVSLSPIRGAHSTCRLLLARLLYPQQLSPPLAMEAAVAHAPPAPALRRSLALRPTTPAVRPDPKPWQGVVRSARRQSNAVRCEPSRRPEPRLRLRAAQPGGADAAAAAAAAGRRKRLAVFVSGGGSNFRAIHEAALGGAVHGDVVALVTDKPGEGNCTCTPKRRCPTL